MKYTLLIVAYLLFHNINAQSFDVIYDQKDIQLHLSGFLNSGTNTIGSSTLFLHRNNDTELGLIRWNLNKAKDLYEEIDETEKIDYWQAGIAGNDDFRISKYKYRYSDIIGGNEGTDHAMVIKDTYSGNSPVSELKVIFPAGSVEIGDGNRLFSTSSGFLQLEDADFIPADCGFNLGSSTIPWYNIHAMSFITEDRCLGPAVLSRKKNFNAVESVEKISVYHNEHLKANSAGRFQLSAKELLKAIPEAVHTFQSEEDSITAPSESIQYGIEYDQLIPVLFQAIQEQQEMIDVLFDKLESLEE